MVNYCCVPRCNGSGGFSFPEEKGLRRKWLIAICRTTRDKKHWKPSEHSVVCCRHFLSSDFQESTAAGHVRERKKLKENVVPSVFPFKRAVKKVSDDARLKRREKREAATNLAQKSEEVAPVTSDAELQIQLAAIEIAMEVELEEAESDEAEEEQEGPLPSQSRGVQVTTASFGNLRLQQFENNPKAVNYYTGFKDVGHLRFFLDCLGPAAFHLKYKSRDLEPEDELFLCLTKLRQNKGNIIFICYNAI